MPMGVAPVGGAFDTIPNINSPKEAAKAFETLLLQQLFKEMSKTVGHSGLMGGGFESKLYSDMFSSSIAETVSGSGSGLSEMIQKSLGVEPEHLDPARPIGNLSTSIRAYRAALTGTAATPSNTYLDAVANDMLSQGSTQQWGRDGELSTRDLAADIVTHDVNGTAVFNVRDASGYKGHPKCNLFAFEMLRRAGYTVPVRARSHGWGYPGADSTTRRAAKEKVSDWASIRTHATTEELDHRARSGQPLLVTSSAPEKAAGHMAVADRIHRVQRNSDGKIASIEYSGWEAGSKGAKYGRRVWRLESLPGKGRGGLDRIEVLEPKWAAGVNNYRPIGNERPGASILDASFGSNVIQGLSIQSDIDDDRQNQTGLAEELK